MGEVLRELEKSPKLRTLVEDRAPGCFLCGYLLRDLNEGGHLTGYPFDFMGKSDFPILSRLRHLILEFSEPPPEDKEATDDDLASVVLHLLDVDPCPDCGSRICNCVPF